MLLFEGKGKQKQKQDLKERRRWPAQQGSQACFTIQKYKCASIALLSSKISVNERKEADLNVKIYAIHEFGMYMELILNTRPTCLCLFPELMA